LTHLGLKQYEGLVGLVWHIIGASAAIRINIWIVWHIIGASVAIEGLVPNEKDALSR